MCSFWAILMEEVGGHFMILWSNVQKTFCGIILICYTAEDGYIHIVGTARKCRYKCRVNKSALPKSKGCCYPQHPVSCE